jgi:serine/threonine-protein kinase
VTAASDLYSVGAMLYEALTGQVPFDAETPVAVALKQVSEAPRPPSELNPNVPQAIDAIVLKALAKDPANRYQSADEFLAALTAAEADPHGSGVADTDAYAAVAAGAAGAAAAGEAGAAPSGGGTTAPPPPGGPGEGQGEERFWTRNRIIAAVLLAVALAGGIVAFVLTRPAKQVLVPAVIDKQQAKATAILQNAGFEVAVSPVPNSAPVNAVTEQDPPAGSRADEGSTVTITVSLGLGQATVPEVSGLDQAAATRALKKRGFKVAIQRRFSHEPDGNAIGTDPAAGAELDRGSTVTLLISKGQNLVTVPSVVGELQDVAVAALNQAGLRAHVIHQNSDEPENQVLSQSLPAGSTQKPNASVTITVSTGAGSIVVPDVVGSLKDDAIARLRDAGVRNIDRVVTAVTDESQDGRVTNEAPSPGSRIRSTDTVTITIARFQPPPPGDNTTSTSTTP